MNSKILGELLPDEHDSDTYYSQPIKIPYFDNEKIVIGIGEANHMDVLNEAEKVLSKFLLLDNSCRKTDSKLLIAYYQACLIYGMTENLDLKEDSDIWNYVKPIEVIVDSEMNSGYHVMISCECKWEEEHGLQLEFKNGTELVRASGHE